MFQLLPYGAPHSAPIFRAMRTALFPLRTLALGPAPRPPRTLIRSRQHSGHTHSESCSHDHHDHTVSPSQIRYTPSPETVTSARNYLSNFLRTHDHASHILTPFIPPGARDAYLAIKSFNLDTALVTDQTSNLAVGRLRMKFWRDAVEAVFKGDGGDAVRYKEPTMVLLASVLSGGGTRGQVPRLNKGWFLRNIAARVGAKTPPPPPPLETRITPTILFTVKWRSNQNSYSLGVAISTLPLPLPNCSRNLLRKHIQFALLPPSRVPTHTLHHPRPHHGTPWQSHRYHRHPPRRPPHRIPPTPTYLTRPIPVHPTQPRCGPTPPRYPLLTLPLPRVPPPPRPRSTSPQRRHL